MKWSDYSHQLKSAEIRDARATPAPEPAKLPHLIRHEPKEFEVQWVWGKGQDWTRYRLVNTLARAEALARTLNSKAERTLLDRRRSAEGMRSQAGAFAQYRVNPKHYPTEP